MKHFKFFIRKFKYSRKNSLLLGMIVLLCFGVTVGYAFLKTTLEIEGALKVAGSTWDIHFENIEIKTGSVTATTAPTITDDTTISFAATLENPGDYYEFTADIVNDGTYDAKLDSLNLVPTLTSAQQEYFNYAVTYYDDLPIQTNDALDAGTSEKIKVVYQYKTNADSSKYPEEDVNFSPEITMNYVQGKGNEVAHSFGTDPWETIIYNVHNNKIPSYYHLGDTKTVDMGTYGTHTVRIANMSTPDECSTTGFSQTACGFVVEFADIITTHRMNPTYDSGTIGTGNVGGWPASEMRTYVNNDVYNALPTSLKNAIIDTTVVSSHGSTTGESNFTSTDKMYLFSNHEIWEDIDGDPNIGINYYDTGYNNTRQLDYYHTIGINSSDYLDASKPYSGNNISWWLRTARCEYNHNFYSVDDNGAWNSHYAYTTRGVSPAFRLG